MKTIYVNSQNEWGSNCVEHKLSYHDSMVWETFVCEKYAQAFFDKHFANDTDAWNCAYHLARLEVFGPRNPFPSIEFLEDCEYSDWDIFVAVNFEDWYACDYGIYPYQLGFCKFNESEYIEHRFDEGFRYICRDNLIAHPRYNVMPLDDYVVEAGEFVIRYPE